MDRKTEVMGWLEGLAQDDWMNWHSDSEVQNTAKAALELLKEQPEIIRCKDCKFWYKDEYSHLCAINGDLRPSNWFCADGERSQVTFK